MKKAYRVKSDKDFQAIFTEGRSVANRKFVVYSLEKDQSHYRVGLSVGKRLGNAVVRNAIKRKLRHVLMELGPYLGTQDFVVIARKGVEELDYSTMKKNLVHVLKLAKRIRKDLFVKKKYRIIGLAVAALLFLSACGRSQVTSHSSDAWEKFVYFFAETIRFLSINGRIGIGIILFTLLIRTILLPLFNLQLKSGQKMQELQPELKALQTKYPGKDRESRMRMAEESQELYKKHGVNPYASLFPLLIQMPVLWALYQALTRVEFLKTGSFLWMDIGDKDPYFILPVLAAIFTFLSSWLTNKAAKERNGMMITMNIILPIFILLIGFNLASGVALYWVVSNAYQVFQILLLNNPFKIIAERQRLEDEARELEAKKRRAKKKAHKKRK